MADIQSLLTSHGASQEVPAPRFFTLSDEGDVEEVALLLDRNPYIRVIDTYESQLLDYFLLQNPWLQNSPTQREEEFTDFKRKHFGERQSWEIGVWVHLPWRHVLVHVLDNGPYQVVRTGRNRNLITPREQKKYYNSVIGIAGQSVGNSCALTIVLTGGGKHLRIADPDTLELTNLNRIRSSIAEITAPKVYMTARQVYELNPYAQIDLFTDGVTEENIEKFFDGPPKLDLVIDEIDQLGLKIRLRQEAKKRGIPLISAVDNGDSGILDIERHDLRDDITFFHGRAGDDLAERVLNQDLPQPQIGQIIGKELVGYDVTEERMQQSLLEIGKSIPTWPQLGTAATLNGAVVAVAARRILTGQSLEDNRVNVSLPALMDPEYMSSEEVQRRAKATEEFSKKFDARIKAFLKQIKKKPSS